MFLFLEDFPLQSHLLIAMNIFQAFQLSNTHSVCQKICDSEEMAVHTTKDQNVPGSEAKKGQHMTSWDIALLATCSNNHWWSANEENVSW
jgi:hypothetical protein